MHETIRGSDMESREPTIRNLTLDDWETYEEFREGLETDFQLDEESFKKLVDGDGCFGLFLDAKQVGYLNLYRIDEDEGNLQGIVVRNEYHGKGYGSMLVKHALDWFTERDLRRVHLYTQVDNKIARGLYTRFGFELEARAWHYIVPLNTLKPLGKYSCQEILEEEIDSVGNKYPSHLSAGRIRRSLESDSQHVLTLKDSEDEIVGVCRFTPGFPGCMPFVLDDVECLDDFLVGLEPYRLPEFDHVRITFSHDHKLAELCRDRGYELYHDLVKMSRDLS
ncbi:MAG: GNAT family N-acetyltransferase [Candidatus Thorarchaeota archaeon]